MISDRLDKVIAAGVLGAIVFTTLAHGTVEPWSAAIFELLIISLMLLWVFKSLVDKRLELQLPQTFWPLAAFLILGIVQSLTFTDGDGRISSLSLDPGATSRAVKLVFFLLAAQVIAVNFFSTKERLLSLSKFLTIFGLCLAVFALIQYFTWNGNLYWFREMPFLGGEKVSGPFVNRNHFAGFLELIIPLPIALIITGAVRQNRGFFAFAAIMMSIAVIASLSRGGMISLVCALLFTFFIGFIYRRRLSERDQVSAGKSYLQKSRLTEALAGLVIAASITGAVIIGTIWIGSDRVIDRLTNNSLFSEEEKAPTFEDSRGWIWKNSLNIFYSNPVTGVGLGAFETAYPKYSENNETSIVNRAHNDYLQILTDMGAAGAVIALWFIGIFVFNLALFLRRDFDPVSAGIALGSAGGVFSLLIHSIFDFNLQILSNALLFLVLTAVFTRLVSGKAAGSIEKPAKSLANKNKVKEEKFLAVGASL
jgi:O-antigen ligase